MSKADIIEGMAKKAGISKKAAGEALDAALDGIVKSLKGGKEVRLIGFGTFSVAARKARQGRNPRTGKPVKIAATKIARFKAGASLKSAVKRAK
jgi:DNA-binding protein HU-beta